MKIIKVEGCMYCQYFKFNQNLGNFNCNHPKFKSWERFMIIERNIALDGELPKWCPLEDYKDNETN